MESGTFLNDEIQDEFKRFVEIRIHTDHPEAESRRAGKQLQAKRFKTLAAPHYAVLDPTGDRLFLWRDDGSAFALSLRPDDLVAAACESAGRALTQQEWSRSIGAGEPYEPACPG